MLPPEYFTNKEDRLLQLYSEFEAVILKDITERLLKAGEKTATAERLAYKQKMAVESQVEMEQKSQSLAIQTGKELRSCLQDAVMASWEEDVATLNAISVYVAHPLENAAVTRIMDAEYQKSLDELRHLTSTTVKQSQFDLMRMIDEADLRAAGGVQSYSAAVCDILDKYAGRGICVDYPSGAQRTLEAAVRCFVFTSMNQMAAQVTNQYIMETGCKYVLVSKHLGARHSKGGGSIAQHDLWQGKIYKIRGEEKDYPNLLASTGYDIDPETGIGKVVNPLGLHGYNCRHSHKPWDLRLANPYEEERAEESQKSRELYAKQQKQRYYERAIKKTKLQLVGKQAQLDNMENTEVKEALQKDYDKIKSRLIEQDKAYHEFCKANKLKAQNDRIKMAGFDEVQIRNANADVKRYKSGLNIDCARNIIKERISNGEYSLSLSKQQYLKHVEGTKQYEDYQKTRMEKGNTPQGRILLSEDEVQALIEKFSGTGTPKVNKRGVVSNIEFISSENVIGQYYKDGKWVETKRAAIHHGRKSSHIVPVEEIEND